MRKFVQVWLAGVVVFVLLIGAASAIGQARGGAMFAFVSDRSGEHEVYIMDVGLGIVHRHNPINTNGWSPTWSPDDVLAFVSDGNLRIDNRHSPTIIETPPYLVGLQWSPDGARIAFRAGNDALFIWNRESGEIDRRTNRSYNVGTFDWSPDSTRIAFIDNSNRIYRTFILDVDSGSILALPDVSPDLNQLTWSPDGTQLVFSVYGGDGGLNIVIWDSRDNSIQTLVQRATDAAWSPDGKWLAYSCGGDVCSINTESGEVRNLTNRPTREFSPSWSPDGNYIVFSELVTYDLYVVEMATGEIRNLTNNAGRWIDGGPAWRP